MREILPGVWHWTTVHERWGIVISSYHLERERVAIDPRVPEEGLDWFEEHGPPRAALLSNRHHYRDAGRYAERFGCPVYVSRLGVQEFGPDRPVRTFGAGEVLPGDVDAIGIGGICADETALLIPAHRAVALADGLVRMPQGGPLGFVPDALMHDPARTKDALLRAYAELLDREIDHLLLAHGDPVIGDGREALRRFLDAGGRP